MNQLGPFSLDSVWGCCCTGLSNQTGDKTLHQTSKNSIFLNLVLPILIMNAAREIDLKLMCQNLSYIFLYGFFGTFLNFVGLFCFIIVFSKTFNLELLDHSNRELMSVDVKCDIDCDWYHFSFVTHKKEEISESPLHYFGGRNHQRLSSRHILPNISENEDPKRGDIDIQLQWTLFFSIRVYNGQWNVDIDRVAAMLHLLLLCLLISCESSISRRKNGW